MGSSCSSSCRGSVESRGPMGPIVTFFKITANLFSYIMYIKLSTYKDNNKFLGGFLNIQIKASVEPTITSVQKNDS